MLDDLEVVREGLRRIVDDVDDLTTVGAGAADPAAFDLVAATHPDVVVCDTGGDSDRLEAIRTLARRFPNLGIVLFCAQADQDLLWEALDAGARGVVLKDAGAEIVLRAVRHVADGDTYVDERVTPTLLRQLSRPRTRGVLSDREREILQMLADGASNREVSELLVLSPETVKTHVKHILAKLEAKHRTQAVAIGIRRALIR